MASVPYTDDSNGGVGLKPMMGPDEKRDTSNVPTKSQPSIIKLIKRMYEKSKAARKERDSKWDSYWDFFKGKQWPVERSSDKASPNCNIIASTINTIAPILTDTSPSFGVLGLEPKDMPFAELISQALKKWWDRRSMNHVLVETLMDSLITDTGVMKVVWDDTQDSGLGDVMVTVVDPRRIFVPKGASDFDRDCPYVIHEFFMSRGKLTLKFPKSAEEIHSAKAWSENDQTDDRDVRVRVVSPVDKDVSAPDNGKDDDGRPNDDIRVWECWLEDDSVVEVESIDNDGKPSKTLKKKYPRGRMVTMLPDPGVLLQDVENPYKDGDVPFVRVVDMLVPRSFYGMGEVQGLSETQMMINKVFAVIMDWCNTMSNPSWVVDDTSNVDPDMLTSDVGQIIMKKAGTQVERQAAPPVPPQLFEMYHTLMSLADTQSGVHEVTQGRKPTGITAAQAIETLQEAAQTRIRLKERNLLVSLQRLGRLIISRMLQYYTEPRVIALTGRDDMVGKWPTYIRWYVEQTDDDMYRPVSQRSAYDEESGGYVDEPPVTGEYSAGEFELDVTSGTSLPFIKEQRSSQAIQLFQAQAIDQQALLDVLEFPEKDSILQRMQEKAAQSQQAEAGAPEMQGPTGVAQ